MKFMKSYDFLIDWLNIYIRLCFVKYKGLSYRMYIIFIYEDKEMNDNVLVEGVMFAEVFDVFGIHYCSNIQ